MLRAGMLPDDTAPHRRAWQAFDVTLPVPPPGPCRRLVQVVWELTFTGLRCPTFAELDRRLDQAHDVQALDVLREMPPGLLWGIGTDSPPTDEQTIGLTVAGIAACPNSDEILRAFIEFVRMAAHAERGWRAASRPGQCLAATDRCRVRRSVPYSPRRRKR